MKLLNMNNSCRKDSPMNRLTPGTKLSMLVLLLTSSLICSSYVSMALLWIFTFVLYGLSGLSPLKWFRRLVPLVPLMILVSLLQVLFRIPNDTSRVFLEWKIFAFSLADIPVIYHFLLRFVEIIGIFFLFTSILTTNEISHGVEEFLRPLEGIHFPVYEAGLVITITFRFIPLLGEELEKITLAQKARGAIDTGKKEGPVRKITGRFPLFIPLFISALTRAEQLAEAMEARGYVVGKPRSRLIHYRKHRGDRILVMCTWLLLGLIIVINRSVVL